MSCTPRCLFTSQKATIPAGSKTKRSGTPLVELVNFQQTPPLSSTRFLRYFSMSDSLTIYSTYLLFMCWGSFSVHVAWVVWYYYRNTIHTRTVLRVSRPKFEPKRTRPQTGPHCKNLDKSLGSIFAMQKSGTDT